MNQIPDTTFAFWTLLFGGFAFIGLFYSIKLIATQGKDKMNLILGVYLLLQSITLLEYVFFWSKYIYTAPHFADVSLLFPLLYGPLLCLYVDKLFDNEKSFKKYILHFVPFILLLILKIPFYLSAAEFKIYHTHDILFGAYFEYYPWLKIWHMTLYCVLLFSMINNQSGVGFMRSWSRWIVGFFSAYVFLSFVYQIIVQFNLLTSQIDYFISLATSCTIFFIAWYGRGFEGVTDGQGILDSLRANTDKVPDASSDLIIQTTSNKNTLKYKNSGLPKSLEIKLSKELEKLMHEDKLFKENDLKLETLANKLNTSKHFVSQVINEVYQVNFFEYINLKRIEEAKSLLKSNPKNELNIIEVAYEVGFNNKGTFNSVFKKITGLTPTEFRKHSKDLLQPRSN